MSIAPPQARSVTTRSINNRRARFITICVMAVGVIVLSGCGAPRDEALENTERKDTAALAHERDAEREVDIETSGKDNEDVEIKSRGGKEVFSTKKELPEGWLPELSFDQRFEIISSSTTFDQDKTTYVVMLKAKRLNADEVVKYITSKLDGWEETTAYSNSGKGVVSTGFNRGVNGEDGRIVVNIRPADSQIMVGYIAPKNDI